MKARFIIIVVLVFISALQLTQAKKFTKCELARALKAAKMPGKLGDWVCLANYESSLNTAARGTNKGPPKSSDNGIFQINSYYWCRDPSFPGKANQCNINCSALRDNSIKDDVACAKKIYRIQGLSAWVAYNTRCKGRNNNNWISGCGV